jgi:preprotein translocase subunit SecE
LDQFKRWWQDTIAELKKVTWPDRETTKNLTLVVIAISIVLGALLGAIDWLMQQIFAAL